MGAGETGEWGLLGMALDRGTSRYGAGGAGGEGC